MPGPRAAGSASFRQETPAFAGDTALVDRDHAFLLRHPRRAASGGPSRNDATEHVTRNRGEHAPTLPHHTRRTDPRWAPRWPVAIGGDDHFAGIEVCALPRRPLRRQGPISRSILKRFRRWREMDTCLSRHPRVLKYRPPIRRTAPHAMMVTCPSGSRIRYRSGREGRDRRVRAGAAVRSAPRQVRPG